MGYLKQLTKYKTVCIQCHDNPDADTIAAAFGVYMYLQKNQVNVDIIYGGKERIEKFNMCYMIEKCRIPIHHVEQLPPCDLLLTVDAQYGQGNITRFEHENIGIIDHHYRLVEEKENYLVCDAYQSCATLVWELLKEENFDVKENENLVIAFLYGLYIDTSSYADLYRETDMEMKLELAGEYPVLDRLTKSNMTEQELLIASQAMQNHELDEKYQLAIVEAIQGDQSVLGIIGDFMIQVDMILVTFVYTEVNEGYQISVRSCSERYEANQMVSYVCREIGSGGGHLKKAGGRISKKGLREKYGDRPFKKVVHELLCEYMEGCYV